MVFQLLVLCGAHNAAYGTRRRAFALASARALEGKSL
jgi:hypothetical protein